MKFLLVSLFSLHLIYGTQCVFVNVEGEVDVKWLNNWPMNVERRLNNNDDFVRRSKNHKKSAENEHNSYKYKTLHTISPLEKEKVTKSSKKFKIIHNPEFYSSREVSSSASQTDSDNIDNYRPFNNVIRKKSSKLNKAFSIKKKETEIYFNSTNLRRHEVNVINVFSERIYTKHLELLSNILNISDVKSLRSKAQMVTADYKKRLSSYLKTVRDNNEWTDGDDASKVVLDTMITTSKMLSLLGQFLINDMKKLKLSGQLRQLDNIDKRMTEIRKIIENEPKESYLYACQRLGICRHGNGFLIFATKMFTTVLENGNEKLKRFHDSFVQHARLADFSGIVNKTFDTELHSEIKKMYDMPALVTRGMYENFVKCLKVRSENRINMYPDALNSRIVELIDILDTIIVPTQENKDKWSALTKMLIDWTKTRRNDIEVIISKIFDHFLMKVQGHKLVARDMSLPLSSTEPIKTTNYTSSVSTIKETVSVRTEIKESMPIKKVIIKTTVSDLPVTPTKDINDEKNIANEKGSSSPDTHDTNIKSCSNTDSSEANQTLNVSSNQTVKSVDGVFSDYEETTCPSFVSASFSDLSTRSTSYNNNNNTDLSKFTNQQSNNSTQSNKVIKLIIVTKYDDKVTSGTTTATTSYTTVQELKTEELPPTTTTNLTTTNVSAPIVTTNLTTQSIRTTVHESE